MALHILGMIKTNAKDSESRTQNQACLSYAEAHPIFYKDSESRTQNQACLSYAKAHPIFYKDRRKSITMNLKFKKIS